MIKIFTIILAIFNLSSCSTLSQISSERYPSSGSSEQIINHGDQVNKIDWRDLFYELNYINQNKMSSGSADFQNRLVNSIYYSPGGFNSAYFNILKDAQTTKELFRNREEILGVNSVFLSKVEQHSQLNKSLGVGADPLINAILSSTSDFKSKLSEDNNYFTSDVGGMAAQILKDYVIVVVPGFGSHTVKDYTWPEILRQANKFYNRPAIRPTIKKLGQDSFQKMEEFYGNNQNVGFDIVHPMGFELGYSMGKDEESGKALAAWLVRLKNIPAYADKKFILIGYSKGTPISLNAVTNQPEISASIAAIFTMAGVAQGSVPANTFVKVSYEKLNSNSKEKLIDDLIEKSKKIEGNITKLIDYSKNLFAVNSSYTKYINQAGDIAKTLMSAGGLGSSDAEDGVSITDKRKAIEGIVDLSNFESVQWNLKNYNNQKFVKPISIFNISMIANIKDFVRPNPTTYNFLTPPLIIPQFLDMNSINYKLFSKDDVFLYLSSVSGFEESVGGMFDTQVAWLDTKSMALDARPLTHSLDPKQLSMIKDRLAKEGVNLPAGFETMPRRNLLKALAVNQGGYSNVNFIDLGEFRGTHWDVAFEQVYKPTNPNQEYYKHQFPRRALQASVIELLAIYKQLGGL